MVVESVAILVVCLAMCGAFFPSRYRKSMKMIFPVMILPAMYLLQTGFLRLLRAENISVNVAQGMIFIEILALAVSCGVVVWQGRHIEQAAGRRIYIWVMVGFLAVLTWVYVSQYLLALLPQLLP